jgi:hypothetical protein
MPFTQEPTIIDSNQGFRPKHGHNFLYLCAE